MGFVTRVKNSLKYRYWNFAKFHMPFLYVKYRYRQEMGKRANLKRPGDLNEKIIWLEYFTDTSNWTILADKYAVRQFVADRIGGEYLVPLIQKWDRAEDIDFKQLPQKFVIKPNNGSYDTFVVFDKSKVDAEQIRERLGRSLRCPFGYDNGEIHYLGIKPCILAETLLETDNELGLVDYKIWCFNGQPYCVFVCVGRDPKTHHAEFTCYDLDWTWRPDMLHPDFRCDRQCPKPKNLSLMLEKAAELSKGLPQCRVDLYNIDGKIYFGEMTLTSNYGMMPYFTKKTLDEMGSLCVLPQRSVSEKARCFFKRHCPAPIR